MTLRAASTPSRLAAAFRSAASDHDLLREFAQHRSGLAFAELVWRYRAMIFGVCRRTLNHSHDAEDAFQATFLVLAHRAARISAPEKLPGWLHRVTVRTATEIRHMRDRRQLVNPDREGGGGLNPDRDGRGDVLEQRELASALDAELAALPDHYRLPVVLCELRGLNRKQAADELSIAEGTLSSRLAKARKLLAERLTKRGFAASVAAVSMALTNTASARIPERLTLLVIESAVGASGSVTAPAVTLATDTVVKALFVSKLKGGVLAGGLLLAMASGMLMVPGWAGA